MLISSYNPDFGAKSKYSPRRYPLTYEVRGG